jgi:hypothetical protein
MTTSNATGYFSNGEVEDYRVLVDDFPLSVNFLSFTATVIRNSEVRLSWTTLGEETTPGFDIERSANGIDWHPVGFVNAVGNGGNETHDYIFNDVQGLKGKSYYRLKFVDTNGATKYSDTKTVNIYDVKEKVSIMPNPANDVATLYINSNKNTEATIIIADMQGREVKVDKSQMVAGNNYYTLNNLGKLSEGIYMVRIIMDDIVIKSKLVIGR